MPVAHQEWPAPGKLRFRRLAVSDSRLGYFVLTAKMSPPRAEALSAFLGSKGRQKFKFPNWPQLSLNIALWISGGARCRALLRHLFIGRNVPSDILRLKKVGMSGSQVIKRNLRDADAMLDFILPLNVYKSVAVRRVQRAVSPVAPAVQTSLWCRGYHCSPLRRRCIFTVPIGPFINRKSL